MKKGRGPSGYITIFGKQPIKEALLSGWPVKELIVRRSLGDDFIKSIVDKARLAGVRVTFLEPRQFDGQFPKSSQGISAKVKNVSFRSLDEVRANIPRDEAPLLVALDGIQDPQNMGAICRTVHAMGVHALIVPRRRIASIGEGAAKASAGAIFHQPICRVPNIHYFVQWAKENGLWVFGLDVFGEKTIWDTDLSGPVALIVGSESSGLSRLVRERCDFLVRIPMYGKISSLNASVACGMALCEIRRQRNAAQRTSGK